MYLLAMAAGVACRAGRAYAQGCWAPAGSVPSPAPGTTPPSYLAFPTAITHTILPKSCSSAGAHSCPKAAPSFPSHASKRASLGSFSSKQGEAIPHRRAPSTDAQLSPSPTGPLCGSVVGRAQHHSRPLTFCEEPIRPVLHITRHPDGGFPIPLFPLLFSIQRSLLVDEKAGHQTCDSSTSPPSSSPSMAPSPP